jgi:hypothetical protein
MNSNDINIINVSVTCQLYERERDIYLWMKHLFIELADKSVDRFINRLK